jgi:predicted PurR-regulated permease PerM
MTGEKRLPDITAVLLGQLCIGALIVAAFLVVRPFLAAAIWATMIVVVTWAFMLRLQSWLWGRRALAITAMLLILVFLFALPLTLAVATVMTNTQEITAQAHSVLAFRMWGPPAWLVSLPFIGSTLSAAWAEAASAGLPGLWSRLEPYAGGATGWLFARAGGVGYLAIEFILTLVLVAFMYSQGEAMASAARRLGNRLGGQRGEDLVSLAGQAIRGVAIGVGLTAVVQSLLGGLGLAVAGVPFAGVLTALLFLLCVAQIGALVVLIPVVGWVYWSGHPILGTVLLIWSVAVGLLDNVLRPLLVRRSVDLPLLLIFVGVVGGLIAFGLVGIFVGPTVLAVAYTLLMAWIGPTPSAAPR